MKKKIDDLISAYEENSVLPTSANKSLAYYQEENEKLSAELIIANKKLQFQNEEKEKRAAELIIANKELQQFAYIASHDLKEPLLIISSYMKIIEEDYGGILDNNAHKYLFSVNKAINRMSILIKSLLDFSRLGHNRKLTNVDCKKLIDDVIADLETIIKTSEAVIHVSEMPKLNLYKTECHQLFQNLISNAIKFQQKNSKPKIQIISEKINGKWKFSIIDNGIGIKADKFLRIFDIFQRLHTNEEYEGSGIGLANCKKIVHSHHGEIWVDSNPTKGSIFNFIIPNLTERRKN